MKFELIFLSAILLIAQCQRPTDTTSKNGPQTSDDKFIGILRNELPSIIENALQENAEKQAHCLRDGVSFYDRANSKCRPCEKYCHQNDYCGTQCEGYFLRKEFEKERTLHEESKAEQKTTTTIANTSLAISVVFGLIVIGERAHRQLTRKSQRKKHNDLCNKQPQSNSAFGRGDNFNDMSSLTSTNSGESVGNMDEEKTNLFNSSSQDNPGQVEITITDVRK